LLLDREFSSVRSQTKELEYYILSQRNEFDKGTEGDTTPPITKTLQISRCKLVSTTRELSNLTTEKTNKLQPRTKILIHHPKKWEISYQVSLGLFGLPKPHPNPIQAPSIFPPQLMIIHKEGNKR
jgi:hypothetical protein